MRIEQASSAVVGRLVGVAAVLFSIEYFEKLLPLLSRQICPLPYTFLSTHTTPVELAWVFYISLSLASLMAVVSSKRGVYFLISLLSLFFALLDVRLYSNHLILLSIFSFFYGASRVLPRLEILLIRAIVIQASIVYLFAGLSKLNVFFLSGAIINSFIGSDALLPVPNTFRAFEYLAPIAILSILVEVSLAILLLSNKYLKIVIVIGVLFHLGLVLTVGREDLIAIVGFAVLMAVAYRCAWETRNSAFENHL